MAGSEDIQDTKSAIRKLISASLGAQLDAIDTANGDEITLDDIATIRFSPSEEHEKYPAITILASSGEKPDEMREVGEGGIWLHSIDLFVEIVGSSGLIWTDPFSDSLTLLPQEVIEIRMARTIEALINLFEANHSGITISGTKYTEALFVDSFTLGEVEGGGDNPYLQQAILSIRVFVST